MRLNPKYSDFTILCGDESFPAHKCIVCPQSKFFSGAMDEDFIVSSQSGLPFSSHLSDLGKLQ